jgi:ABC-type transporter Mla subunit MlaD
MHHLAFQQIQQIAQELSQAELRHAQQLNALAQEESQASSRLQQIINQLNQYVSTLAQASSQQQSGGQFSSSPAGSYQQPQFFGPAQFSNPQQQNYQPIPPYGGQIGGQYGGQSGQSQSSMP